MGGGAELEEKAQTFVYEVHHHRTKLKLKSRAFKSASYIGFVPYTNNTKGDIFNLFTLRVEIACFVFVSTHLSYTMSTTS